MAEQGDRYSTFIEGQLKDERDRRASHEARGAAMVTSSAAFVTLVFALTAVVVGEKHKYGAPTKVGVILSLLFFIGAAVAGLGANRLISYRVASDTAMRTMLSTRWSDSEVTARNSCAWQNVETLQDLRIGNNAKARLITRGLTVQLVGVAALTFAIFWELVTL